MTARWQQVLEDRARAALSPPLHEYVVQGAREGVTTDEAVRAWQEVRFLPRALRDVTTVDLSATLLGARTEVPWAIAPTTLQREVHPDGELAMARAAREAGTVVVVSSNSGTRFADLGETGARWWLQAYLPQDRSLATGLLRRAVEAGAEAVVLTVDTPVVGTKYAAGDQVVWDVVDPERLRVNFDPVDGAEGSAADKATDLGPQDVAWLASVTGLPVVVKGVLRSDDAVRCVEAGAAAVWVSNHGGRQLDRAIATAQALPRVVEAVAGRAPVYVDGGVRSGTDVLAALALGADAVFLGRLPLLALVDGEPGVASMHARLREELLEAMRLSGCAALSDARGIVVQNP
ncbi:alpha-hydroxy acid oxidase [Nocardioides sp. GCM10027113]|uniref:alpha-hydroxy acid oxidase n=1 Tax=unclassified Nocardioides TaxID=2615069 RepID=UPI003610FC20